MSWLAAEQALAGTIVQAFSEPVTLADASVISAVFDLNNPQGWGLGAGVQDMLDAQPQPTLQLTEAAYAEHARFLEPGRSIAARGIGYVIAEPAEPDGAGLMRLTLMAHQPQDHPATGAERWSPR